MQTTLMNRIRAFFLRATLCFAIVVGGTLASTPVYAEEAAPAAAEGGAAKAKHKSHSLVDKFIEGGWVMYPLTLCSVILVWLTTDLWMKTASKKVAPDAAMGNLQELFRAGDYVGAYQFAKNNPAIATDTARVALSFIGDGQDSTEYSILDGLNKSNAQLQTRINYLSVIGVCTPMIGLTGTVTGMMSAFETLGSDGVGNPSALSAAIGEVLIATAAGLFIAIPAFMFFYVLRNRLQAAIQYAELELQKLFRKMPYAQLKGCHVGEEEFFAAPPNWLTGGGEAPAEAAH
jgi:biopolymer transport protein ExbB